MINSGSGRPLNLNNIVLIQKFDDSLLSLKFSKLLIVSISLVTK